MTLCGVSFESITHRAEVDGADDDKNDDDDENTKERKSNIGNRVIPFHLLMWIIF